MGNQGPAEMQMTHWAPIQRKTYPDAMKNINRRPELDPIQLQANARGNGLPNQSCNLDASA